MKKTKTVNFILKANIFVANLRVNDCKLAISWKRSNAVIMTQYKNIENGKCQLNQ